MPQDYFQHALALVESDEIGPGCRIWAWAHVMHGARIGANCNIGEHCFIERGAVLGNRVTVKNGVMVWDGVTAEDDVFVGPHAVLTNDRRPRSRNADFRPRPTLLGRGCSIGANATLLSDLHVGRYALVGAGCVVTRDVPDHALVVGNPARLQGYVCVCSEDLRFEDDVADCRCGRAFRCEAGRVEPIGDGVSGA